MSVAAAPSPHALVLFGATGDLARRMLLPSLYHLHREGRLEPGLKVVGAARAALTPEAFRDQAAAAVRERVAGEHLDEAALAGFRDRLDYVAVDAADPKGFADLAERLTGPAVFYLAVSPDLYGPVARGLADAGLAGPHARLVLEKPIGRDLASSRAVNDAVGAVFAEDRIFRIDHYLGKETVQNLMVLRFGNSLFEPLWNATRIEQVQITVAETVGLEGRAAYYEGVGALRDMVQNHVLQLLALVAMEAPSGLDPSAVRDEKIKVLRSLRPISERMIDTWTVAGQYESGAVDGTPVRGYAEELGRASDTETFVALRVEIDNWRWAGVPFYLRTGKRLARRDTEIVIQFKPAPHNLFAAQRGVLAPNKLVISLQPQENISLSVMAKEPGLEHDGVRLREVALDLSLSEAFEGVRRRIAYERLILDVLKGDATLFVRRDEVEAAWTWIDGVAEGWRKLGLKPKRYAAGGWGPSAAIALTERMGHSWHE